jgi:hypothetical protein
MWIHLTVHKLYDRDREASAGFSIFQAMQEYDRL